MVYLNSTPRSCESVHARHFAPKRTGAAARDWAQWKRSGSQWRRAHAPGLRGSDDTSVTSQSRFGNSIRSKEEEDRGNSSNHEAGQRPSRLAMAVAIALSSASGVGSRSPALVRGTLVPAPVAPGGSLEGQKSSAEIVLVAKSCGEKAVVDRRRPAPAKHNQSERGPITAPARR